jgi:hypothetical protein
VLPAGRWVISFFVVLAVTAKSDLHGEVVRLFRLYALMRISPSSSSDLAGSTNAVT